MLIPLLLGRVKRTHIAHALRETLLLLLLGHVSLILHLICSEGVTIPKNPRTERSVGYAFVDLSTPTEAERAIAELSGKEILERKVSVQLARKPEPNAEKTDANGEGEGTRRRQSTRGRGRGTRARGGRAGRAREVRQKNQMLYLGQWTDMSSNRIRKRAMRALLPPPPRLLQLLRFNLCKTSPTRPTTLTLLARIRHKLVLLVSAANAARQPMAFPPRPRSWWLTCPTI